MKNRLRIGSGLGLGLGLGIRLFIGLGSGFDCFRRCAVCVAPNTESLMMMMTMMMIIRLSELNKLTTDDKLLNTINAGCRLI